VTLELLFAVAGSGSVAETDAVFVTLVAVAAMRTTSEMVAPPPGATVPIEHVTVAPLLQLPCVVETETKLVRKGRTSVTTTFVALCAVASFLTVIV
jgi:hypothetical protein